MIRFEKLPPFLGGLFLIMLVHPFRFSELPYSLHGIKSKDIKKHLVSNAVISSKKLEICPLDMNQLQSWTFDKRRKLLTPKLGGEWRPTECAAEYDSTIIIPYRNRQDHLDVFVQWIHSFLQAQNLSYLILLVEQTQDKKFNRAKLFNIGAIESKKLKMGIRQCYIFHDIDLLPMNAQNLYACSRLPLHLSSFIDTMRYNLPYASLFGGAVAVMQDMFEAVNGFSNEYSGWGGEDDDFWSNRLGQYTNNRMIRYDSSIGKYQMLPHQQAQPSESRFENLRQGRLKVDVDGLANTEYTIISHVKRELYTHLLVEI